MVWLRFDPQTGHEQRGRRPAVIMSPGSYNRLVGLAFCCPVTSRVKGYPFEVPLPPGLGIEGVILSDQLKGLDWRVRKARRIGTMNAIRTIVSALALAVPLLARADHVVE